MKPTAILQLPSSFRISALSLLFGFCCLMSACNGGCGTGKKSIDKLELPANGSISKEEAARLHDSCLAWYNRTLENSAFSGGLLIAKDGNIVFEKYRGEIIPKSGQLISDTTPIHIASVSKTFTAMAVLKLQEQGKLGIDDWVEKYIEGFPYTGVTIRHLLTHRSGLPNYTSFMDVISVNRDKWLRNEDLPQILINYKDQLPPAGNPGRHFSYCNTNYALLALVIEKASGKNYGDYLEQQFFRPLGMHHSLVRTDSSLKNIHLSCDWRGQVIPDNYLDLVYGDKNVYSTPRDLLTWEKALRSGLLFSKETLEQAYTPYSNEKPGKRNYGLGWRLILYPDGNKLIYHNGWWHGNNAVFIRIPQVNAAIIVLGNRFTKTIYKAKELISVFSETQLPDEEE